MGFKVKISESANVDLETIFNYIAEELSNPKAATDFADALSEKYMELEEHPFMFEVSRNERLAELGYRRFVIGSYIALYLVNEERQEVTIARIFYGKQNYGRYI